MKKDIRYSCYPFMREKSSLVDYEIRTDSLTSRIGAVLPAILDDELATVVLEDLRVIHPLAYHVNGSVRGKLAITEENLNWLSARYDFYVKQVEQTIQQFLLPQGVESAARLHICRSEAKKSYRALHKVSEERDVPEILFDFLGLLANVLFVMAVYMNKQHAHEEIPFISKSYPMKKKKGES
ncbi:hypothetical protein DCE79_05245 [Lysinibacillus sp. 2017]|uniref:hypothetical protein n=1 Tax=unclassified Lysinibacillus TaxID=2636778 RepID=UPI000D526CAA|nr:MULTISPECIES: hypothetical protein [unclassified Lysinibacillus]AWE06837.1 hypothetical protein DCE79_05245 [Lysinibacillus sp. 2017]TGN37232.1 hypothetical protein E4L99_01750 [Lysinibacillus sp. S2017]